MPNPSATRVPSGEPELDLILAPVRAALSEVDSLIRERLRSDVVLINQIAEHIISGGGKRLRPVLVLLSAGACSYSGRDHIQLAAVVEFIHTATLLHDDVVDDSDLRRGRKTANAVWGNAASVLVGDFLYSRAFQMMVSVDRMAVMKLLADTTNAIAEGEVLQLLSIGNPDTDEAAYLRVIGAKTATLFDAAARLGAMLAGRPEAEVEALGRYGERLGLAFQIADDVLDYTADAATLGKNLGDDLAEGKVTLPLLHALRQGSLDERAMIRDAVAQGRLDRLSEIVATVRRLGGIDYSLERARGFAEEARSAIAGLPESRFKISLDALAQFAVVRRA